MKKRRRQRLTGKNRIKRERDYFRDNLREIGNKGRRAENVSLQGKTGRVSPNPQITKQRMERKFIHRQQI